MISTVILIISNIIICNIFISTSVYTGAIALVYTHFLNINDIILVDDNSVMLLS